MIEPVFQLTSLGAKYLQDDGCQRKESCFIEYLIPYEYGLPRVQERATAAEYLRFLQAAVNHISLAQCAGFAGGLFTEVHHVWRALQIQWGGAFRVALHTVVVTTA